MKSVLEEKKYLRRHLRGLARELSKSERQRRSQDLQSHLFDLIKAHEDWQVLGSFVGLVDEPDLGGLMKSLPDRRWVYPKVLSNRQLNFFFAESLDGPGWVRGPFGLFEPDPDLLTEVGIGAIDAVLVPAAGLDRDGGRLGKGGGYYDRWIEAMPRRVPLVGVGFDCQRVARVPVEAHDCRVDFIATEQGVWRAGESDLVL